MAWGLLTIGKRDREHAGDTRRLAPKPVVVWHLYRTPDQEIWCLVTKVSMSARELDSPGSRT